MTKSLFQIMQDIIDTGEQKSDSPYAVTAWKTVGDFLILLSRHYTYQHNVKFYAESLNITPDYLSVLVRNCTDETPKAFIDGKLILAIKAMIEGSDISIKNIADRLHYEDTSHLCKVFRRHTGMSPMEYRKHKCQ